MRSSSAETGGLSEVDGGYRFKDGEATCRRGRGCSGGRIRRLKAAAVATVAVESWQSRGQFEACGGELTRGRGKRRRGAAEPAGGPVHGSGGGMAALSAAAESGGHGGRLSAGRPAAARPRLRWLRVVRVEVGAELSQEDAVKGPRPVLEQETARRSTTRRRKRAMRNEGERTGRPEVVALEGGR